MGPGEVRDLSERATLAATKEHPMLGLRPMEIILIAFALVLLFGASRLPALGSSLGAAIKNFKKGFSESTDDSKPEDKKLSQNDGNTIAAQDKATTKQS